MNFEPDVERLGVFEQTENLPRGFVVAVDGRTYSVTFAYNPPHTVALVVWGKDFVDFVIGHYRGKPGEHIDAVQATSLALADAVLDSLPDGQGPALHNFYLEMANERQTIARQIEQGEEGYTDPMEAVADMMGRRAAREGLENPEDSCPECEKRDECPIFQAFVAEQIVIAAEIADVEGDEVDNEDYDDDYDDEDEIPF